MTRAVLGLYNLHCLGFVCFTSAFAFAGFAHRIYLKFNSCMASFRIVALTLPLVFLLSYHVS